MLDTFNYDQLLKGPRKSKHCALNINPDYTLYQLKYSNTK